MEASWPRIYQSAGNTAPGQVGRRIQIRAQGYAEKNIQTPVTTNTTKASGLRNKSVRGRRLLRHNPAHVFFLKIYYETSSDFENVSENADRALLDRVKVIMNKFVRRTFIILLFPLEIYENELVTKAFDHQIIGLQISVQLNIKYK